MLPNQIDAHKLYTNFSKELGIKIDFYPGLEKLVNFKDNATMPVHRWYFFKEGYSHQLVRKLLAEFNIKKDSTVLDPFAGSGTTLLSSQWEEMHPVGIDINPFFTFVERTKLDWFKYDLTDLTEKIDSITKIKCESTTLKPPELSSFTRKKGAVFSSQTLNDLLCFKEHIISLENGTTKNFLKLVLAAIMESVSLVKKDGKGLKFVKGKNPPTVKSEFKKKSGEMLTDLKYVKKSAVDGTERLGKREGITHNFDNRSPEQFQNNIDPESVDFIMFSPPYLNTFDYTEVYKLELWFLDFVKDYDGFKNLRSKTLRSHNLWNWEATNTWNNPTLEKVVDHVREQKLWNKIIPTMIQGYFDDMHKTLANLKLAMKTGTFCTIIVGNSCYGDTPIATDLFLTKAAKDVGLEPIEIRIARRLGTSSQQLKRITDPELRQYLRESIIVLKK